MNNTLSIAEQWLELGIATIPIRRGSKKPALRWRPYIERLPRLDELRAWWPFTNGNSYGIAVIAGWGDLAIIDFDDMQAHEEWLAGLSPALAALVETTYKVQTRRGLHIYVYSAEPAETRSFKSDGLGFDLRGPGGYVLAPNTIHPSGRPYKGIGGPLDIQHVNSIYELVPSALEVQKATEALRYEHEDPEEDLWDLAMRDPINASIEEIKQHFSIAGLLNKPTNGNGRRWVTLCPLHAETSPSFTVFPDGHAHCFGCGWRGDVVDLFAALHNLSNREAIRQMAAKLR